MTCKLGCGDTRVLIMDRCGNRTMCDLTEQMNNLTYGRLMDDTSEAKAVFNLSGESDQVCCACLGDTRTWLNTMAVFRDGDLVWGPGPVTNLLYTKDTVVVTARDVTAWLDVRAIHSAYNFVDEDPVEVARVLVHDALRPDDPCLILTGLVTTASSNKISKAIEAGNTVYAGDTLRELARTAVDFTVIGQSIIIADELLYGPYTLLTDADFQTELEIEERGTEAGSKWYVVGSDNSIIGVAGGTDPYIGLVEQIATEDTITDVRTANLAARGREKGSSPTPLYINIPDNAQLSPDAPVCFDQLVPGTIIPVQLSDTCRQIEVANRLTAVSVSVDASGGEKVGVSLTPLGIGFDQAGFRIGSRPGEVIR